MCCDTAENLKPRANYFTELLAYAEVEDAVNGRKVLQ
jgi:hypothetical protein